MTERTARALGPVAALVAAGLTPAGLADPFADSVWGYFPAPGQFVNDPSPTTGGTFNDPSAALGAPRGGGANTPDNSKLVNIGGFGGSIVLRFDETVADDPCNPLGLDAIVFGNGFWVAGDPAVRWAEAGVIEIALDSNGNGEPDDGWFVVPGSSVPTAATGGAPADVIETQPWDDDPSTGTPPAEAGWYPDPALYPGWQPASTTAFRLPPPFDATVLTNPVGDAETYFGYADLSPVLALGDMNADGDLDDPEDLPGIAPEVFYVVPDNPFEVGITPGSGGGDAFDIASAVDPLTGEPAGLPGFDFLRITTGVNAIAGPFGERSPEIGGASDVAPDPSRFDLDGGGARDAEDIYLWHSTQPLAPGRSRDADGDGAVDTRDRVLVQRCARAGESADQLGAR